MAGCASGSCRLKPKVLKSAKTPKKTLLAKLLSPLSADRFLPSLYISSFSYCFVGFFWMASALVAHVGRRQLRTGFIAHPRHVPGAGGWISARAWARGDLGLNKRHASPPGGRAPDRGAGLPITASFQLRCVHNTSSKLAG